MHKIYTCGYLNLKSPEQLVNWVRQNNALVVDIRMSAYSANPRWIGGSLKKLLGENYMHLKQFGNVNYKNGGEIKLLNPEEGTVSVSISLATGPVLLMCACKDHETCHRSHAAAYLQAHLGEVNSYFNEVEVVHLQAADFALPGGSSPELPKQLRLF